MFGSCSCVHVVCSASVADNVDGFVVMVTASGPSTIQLSIAGKCTKACAVYFPKEVASYQVTHDHERLTQ